MQPLEILRRKKKTKNETIRFNGKKKEKRSPTILILLFGMHKQLKGTLLCAVRTIFNPGMEECHFDSLSG